MSITPDMSIPFGDGARPATNDGPGVLEIPRGSGFGGQGHGPFWSEPDRDVAAFTVDTALPALGAPLPLLVGNEAVGEIPCGQVHVLRLYNRGNGKRLDQLDCAAEFNSRSDDWEDVIFTALSFLGARPGRFTPVERDGQVVAFKANITDEEDGRARPKVQERIAALKAQRGGARP